MVFQDFKLLPNLTVFQNVGFALRVTEGALRHLKPKVEEVLSIVGLEGKENKFPDQLSGGEQQRVAIARAFVTQPDLLFADEPTGNLDTHTGQRITELLFELNRSVGSTLVLVTHDRALARRCGRILELDAGHAVSGMVS
jgi:putative ABC transport system ATP-binding protein